MTDLILTRNHKKSSPPPDKSGHGTSTVPYPTEKYQLFPPLTDEEYQALKNDIAEHGILVPIEIDESGPFWIYQYQGGDPKPDPPIYDLLPVRQCGTWADLGEWEKGLRNGGHN